MLVQHIFGMEVNHQHENPICQLEFKINLFLHYLKLNSINMEPSVSSLPVKFDVDHTPHKYITRKPYVRNVIFLAQSSFYLSLPIPSPLSSPPSSSCGFVFQFSALSHKRLLFHKSILSFLWASQGCHTTTATIATTTTTSTPTKNYSHKLFASFSKVLTDGLRANEAWSVWKC